MSKITLTPHASGTGTLNIAAPNTNSTRTLTLPDADLTLGNVLTTASDVVAAKLTGALPAIDGSAVTSLTSANLTGALPWDFTSSNQTITTGSTLSVAHGLGAKPTRVQVTIVCITTDLGYAVGDEIQIPFVVTNVAWGAIASANDTNVQIRTAVDGFMILKAANWAYGVMASASWNYVVRASL